ncbi:MAG: alpha/beta fold hydrolase [Candidatus Helarchaeota archaeon]
MPKLKIEDNIEIYYKVSGKGPETILLIQGLGHKSSGWQLQIPFFKKKKMRVICYDNIGVGKSSRPDFPYTMELYVKIIKKLLEHLDIQVKIHLCGISMGGMIAQHFVLEYPELVKTLILLATSAKCNVKPLIDIIKSLESKSEEEKMNELLPALFSNSFVRRIKKDAVLYEMLKQDFQTDPTRAQDYVNQSYAIEHHDTREMLNKIKIPTLIIVGSKDILLPFNPHSKLLSEKIPNSKLEIIKGVGHANTIEAADKVNNLIWDFIKDYFE